MSFKSRFIFRFVLHDQFTQTVSPVAQDTRESARGRFTRQSACWTTIFCLKMRYSPVRLLLVKVRAVDSDVYWLSLVSLNVQL